MAVQQQELELLRRGYQPASPEEPAVGRQIPYWKTPDGWSRLTIHHSLVPDYDYEDACEGLTDEAIRQELEIDWSASKGRRVYPEFGSRLHVALDPLPFNQHRALYCGWDFGGTPAFVISQLNAFGQWLIYPGLAPSEDATIGVYEFGHLVADYIQREFATPYGKTLRDLKLIHFGDPAGAARPPRTGDKPEETQSCFEILEKGLKVVIGHERSGHPIFEVKPGFGFKIQPGAVNITERLEAVRARLKMVLKDGLPALVVDPRAAVIKDAFNGGYTYPQRHDGTYDDKPKKNWYSHSMDALQYVATRLFVTMEGEEEEDEDRERRTEFRSQAAGRHRLAA